MQTSTKGGISKATVHCTGLAVALPTFRIIWMMTSNLWHPEFYYITGKNHGGAYHVSPP
ncbi:hypothetical protein H4F46_13930 [Pectobacterium brasiliense]|uniref:hypothetical protein n=1 Tax=Pectobacterium TaxID=122277 RepID=UPI001601C4CA|nr:MULTISPECIES: hypothetical protein [Pectobacterium]MBB1525327.1 hypothetical protein [Pectobacterium carotovorum subsp. carotovorum]MBN3115990.1 hypothetical protein [Pectobacterium brasiliense]